MFLNALTQHYCGFELRKLALRLGGPLLGGLPLLRCRCNSGTACLRLDACLDRRPLSRDVPLVERATLAVDDAHLLGKIEEPSILDTLLKLLKYLHPGLGHGARLNGLRKLVRLPDKLAEIFLCLLNGLVCHQLCAEHQICRLRGAALLDGRCRQTRILLHSSIEDCKILRRCRATQDPRLCRSNCIRLNLSLNLCGGLRCGQLTWRCWQCEWWLRLLSALSALIAGQGLVDHVRHCFRVRSP